MTATKFTQNSTQIGKSTKTRLDSKKFDIFLFLKSIGFKLGKCFSEKHLSQIENGAYNLSHKKHDPAAEHKITMHSVFILVLLYQIDEIANTGLPSNLIDGCAVVLAAFFEKNYPEKWKQYSELFEYYL